MHLHWLPRLSELLELGVLNLLLSCNLGTLQLAVSQFMAGTRLLNFRGSIYIIPSLFRKRRLKDKNAHTPRRKIITLNLGV